MHMPVMRQHCAQMEGFAFSHIKIYVPLKYLKSAQIIWQLSRYPWEKWPYFSSYTNSYSCMYKYICIDRRLHLKKAVQMAY